MHTLFSSLHANATWNVKKIGKEWAENQIKHNYFNSSTFKMSFNAMMIFSDLLSLVQ